MDEEKIISSKHRSVNCRETSLGSSSNLSTFPYIAEYQKWPLYLNSPFSSIHFSQWREFLLMLSNMVPYYPHVGTLKRDVGGQVQEVWQQE